MKLLAIVGSYRKGKTIDTLVDAAIEGARSVRGDDLHSDKIYLVDHHIEYCQNCMVCRHDDPGKSRARCVIDDDMQNLYPLIEEADAYIFGTPVNMATLTAAMKTFVERTCWVFAKPGSSPLEGCPTPRSTKPRTSIISVSSGLVPPLLRRWCDDATPLLKSQCHDILGAKVRGTLYAGAVEKRGVEHYLARARRLGQRLAS